MVTLALVGAGSWGKNYLATAKDIADVEITHVVGRRNDIAAIPDTIDGVIIATPAKTHYPLAKHFLEKGQNLLIEKPLALSVRDARDLEKTAKKSSSRVLVGHLYLYNPAYRAAKALIPSIGELKNISFKGLVSPARSDVSVLWDWGPHPVSLFLDLINERIARISAEGSRERITFSLDYRGGPTAKAEIAWTGTEKKRELVIEGSKGKKPLVRRHEHDEYAAVLELLCGSLHFSRVVLDVLQDVDVENHIESILNIGDSSGAESVALFVLEALWNFRK